MELKDFMNMNKLQEIQNNFSEATGLAAIAVGKNGEYITEGSNFTDFCMKYTRGSKEGNRRCVKCDNECSGTYFCHAGLMDFSVEMTCKRSDTTSHYEDHWKRNMILFNMLTTSL